MAMGGCRCLRNLGSEGFGVLLRVGMAVVVGTWGTTYDRGFLSVSGVVLVLVFEWWLEALFEGGIARKVEGGVRVHGL